MIQRAKAGPWQTVSWLTMMLCGFQRRHGQQLIKRLALTEAQTHGEVNWHHSGLGVTKSMENSVEEAMMGLK